MQYAMFELEIKRRRQSSEFILSDTTTNSGHLFFLKQQTFKKEQPIQKYKSQIMEKSTSSVLGRQKK